jgi:hypothetical protein
MRSATSMLLLTAAAALTACDDGDPAEAPPVVARTEAADAATCPAGGARVLSGPDRDGDGTLDDDEVTTRTAVCSSAPVVVRVGVEPPGGNCEHGGGVVASGPDRDGDGDLDDDEVATVDYVCDDAILTRLDAEPEGARCAGGGVVFRTGRDRDGDGSLDDTEVDDVEVDCSEFLSRDYIAVESAADLAALSQVRAIRGTLVVRDGADITAAELPRLEHVGALFIARLPSATRVALPALMTIDHDLSLLGNPALTAVDAPELDQIGGDVTIEGNAALAGSVLREGVVVGGDIAVRGNAAMTELVLAAEARGGSLLVIDNARLERIDVTGWMSETHIDDVVIRDNPALATIVARTDIGNVFIEGNDALTSLYLSRGGAGQYGTYVVSPALASVTLLGHHGVSNSAGGVSIEGPITALDLGEHFSAESFRLTGSRLTRLDPDGLFLVSGTASIERNPLLESVDISTASDLRLTDNATLLDVHFGSGALSHLELRRNAVLASLAGFERLRYASSSILIEQNPALPTCAVDALFARVDAPVELAFGNDDDGVCP